MKLLLDTCEFLWLVAADPKLPDKVAKAVADPRNEVYLSVVSFWEIAVKQALGKWPLPQPAPLFVPAQRTSHRIEPLDLTEAAVARLPALPPLHRDPFHRMLICQALAHNLTFASSDPLVRQYPITFL